MGEPVQDVTVVPRPEPTLEQKLENVRRAAGFERKVDAWAKSAERSEYIENAFEISYRRIELADWMVKLSEENPKAYARLIEKFLVKRVQNKHEIAPALPDEWVMQASAKLVEIRGAKGLPEGEAE